MSTSLSPLYAPMMASEAMRAICADAAYVQAMLDVEAALARAQSRLGLIPDGAGETIAAACRAELYDLDALALAARQAGNLAIPLVKQLTARVGKSSEAAARYVHWGATSQDIIDTALVLVVRDALGPLLADLDRAIAGFGRQAREHRTTLMAGRTWLQHALPIPLGLKLAGYAAGLQRAKAQLARVRGDNLVLQFGGAAGTLAALGPDGLRVAAELATALKLDLPDAPWHTHRDRIADLAAQLAILAGTCGKIARDVSLLMQTDVAEAFEPAAEGRGGSSTMPHKRNPVGCAVALAAATTATGLAATVLAAQVQDHERSAGPWHAEWLTLPTLLLTVSGGLAAIADVAEGLEVDADRMRQNLDATQGLVMAEAASFALARHVGKAEAHRLIEAASRKVVEQKRHLREVLLADAAVTAHLSAAEIDSALDPSRYQGVAQELIDRQLAGLD